MNTSLIIILFFMCMPIVKNSIQWRAKIFLQCVITCGSQTVKLNEGLRSDTASITLCHIFHDATCLDGNRSCLILKLILSACR